MDFPEKKMLFLPMGLTAYRYSSWRLAIRMYLIEWILIIPPVVSHIAIHDVISLIDFIATFALLYILLISIYELQYVINDLLFSKYEDRPTLRFYPVSIWTLVLSRIISIVLYIAILLLSSLYGIESIQICNVTISLSLLVFAFLVHNIQKIKLKRILTFSLIRIVRLLFVPVALLGSSIIPEIVLITLPYVFIEVIEGFRYNLSKYGITTPPIQYRWYYIYGLFLPLQYVALRRIEPLSGVILLFTASLVKNTIAK